MGKRFIACAAAGVLALAAGQAQAVLIYANTGTQIAQFDSASPGTLTNAGGTPTTVSGLNVGETLLGIDVRPVNQDLVGVTSTNRLVRINRATFAILDFLPLVADSTDTTAPFFTSVSGTNFGVDFNPAADRLRVVSDTGQNLRINPFTGAVSADLPLTTGTTITGAAYDRNAPPPQGGTTLFVINAANGNLARQGDVNGTPDSPNNGAVTNLGSLGRGATLDPRIGFDISGTGAGTAFASFVEGGVSRLYTVNTAGTPSTALVGTIGGTGPYLGITQAVAIPEPAGLGLLGVGSLVALRRRRRVVHV